MPFWHQVWELESNESRDIGALYLYGFGEPGSWFCSGRKLYGFEDALKHYAAVDILYTSALLEFRRNHSFCYDQCSMCALIRSLTYYSHHIITVVTSQPRMSLLLLVVTALDGVWSVEQPSGSFLEYYPRFRSVMRALGEGAVPRLGLQVIGRTGCCYVSTGYRVSRFRTVWFRPQGLIAFS